MRTMLAVVGPRLSTGCANFTLSPGGALCGFSFVTLLTGDSKTAYRGFRSMIDSGASRAQT